MRRAEKIEKTWFRKLTDKEDSGSRKESIVKRSSDIRAETCHLGVLHNQEVNHG